MRILVRPWVSRRVVVSSMMLLVALAGPTWADETPPLVRARHAIESLDYVTARTALTEALDAGTNGADELAEIYLLMGIVSSSLGDPAAGTDAFSRLLEISPKASLVAGTSPKIAKPFAAASELYKTRQPLRVTTETSVMPPTITVVVASDPMTMVASARVAVVADGKPEQALQGTGTDRIKVALPFGKRLEARVTVLDAHGNRLVELPDPIVIEGAEEPKPVQPVTITPPPPPPSPPPSPRPLYAQWWLWGGVSVVLAGTATAFGFAARSSGRDLDALNADSVHHDFQEAKDIEARIHRDALLANIGFGAAGAAAIASAILFVTQMHTSSQERRVTTVRPAPIRGGASVTLEVPF